MSWRSLGRANARAMAAGVSQATIPTMAGMVAALSGLYFGSYLERKADTEAEALEDLLRYGITEAGTHYGPADTQAKDEPEINITPMLDIVFIMLIFFIVTTSFIRETGVEVDKPTAISTEGQATRETF